MNGSPPRPHRFSLAHLDGLARGSVGAEHVQSLRAGQLSKRLALLRIIMDAAGRASHGRATTGFDDAFALLARAQRADPHETNAVLLAPQVGVWMATCLRGMHGPGNRDPSLHADDDFLGSIAAAAAIRADIEFEAPVPVSRGTVTLPSLGVARLTRSASSTAAVVCRTSAGIVIATEHDRIHLPADPRRDAPGWECQRRVDLAAGGLHLRVTLDDVGAFRLYDEFASERRSPESFASWRRNLADAWALLTRSLPEQAPGIATQFVSIVPLNDSPGSPIIGATTDDAFGCAALSPALAGADLAAALVHEAQHGRLGALSDLIPLVRSLGPAVHYAPWRDDPRPVAALLQGVYAFMGVVLFWHAYRKSATGTEAALADFNAARWHGPTLRAVGLIEAEADLTETGRRFVAGMRETLLRWTSDEIPDVTARLACEVAADHRVIWRLLHRRPHAEDVGHLTRAWLSGSGRVTPIAIRTAVEAAPISPGLHRRAALVRLRIAEPARFRSLYDDALTRGEAAPGPLRADLACAAGDYRRAAEMYTRLIADDPAALWWAGLGWALRGTDAGHALLRQPETVRAVYRAVLDAGGVPPDPIALADWLDQKTPACLVPELVAPPGKTG